ncbi:hypothetical protein CBR_g17954 [Chara braunii]|uniref:Protein kinase domain-containing protein n=1 Tax=Chara braunii TaxID=69332 RepID=A0A388KW11_CHABU|nr:hypothetical protein CBR_g17954 [Chara braunii]|eukprot:GBG74244.1 hypothetical protein CBR_g17954 [Chara braunii]
MEEEDVVKSGDDPQTMNQEDPPEDQTGPDGCKRNAIEEEDVVKSGDDPQTRIDKVAQIALSEGWLLRTDKVSVHQLVGSGSSAEIYRATWYGLDVALKCMKQEFFAECENSVDCFLKEVQLLAKIRHPCIIRLLAASFVFPQRCWLVLEYLPCGTLTEWLHGDKARQWKRKVALPPFEERYRIALEIALAMQYLHEQSPPIIHRDLKPSNIFLDDCKHVRLADFGCATPLLRTDKKLAGEMGTHFYMSPEVFQHKHYDEKCDVYSFGVLLNEIMTGDPPYIDTYLSPIQIAQGVADGDLRPTLLKDEHPALVALISATINQDPAKRPSFSQITQELKSRQDQALAYRKTASTGALGSNLPAFQQFAGWWQSVMGTGSGQTIASADVQFSQSCEKLQQVPPRFMPSES